MEFRFKKLSSFVIALLLYVVPAMTAVAEESASAATEEEQERAQPVMDGLLGGQWAWEKEYDRALLEGRDFYNDEALEEARKAFIRAIQIMAEEPAGYRNLARTYHWLGKYPEATTFYDHYLRLAPDAGDIDVIREERRSAASRSDGELWTVPGDQRMAHRSLVRELEDGRAITTGGGGAWGLYQTLLRMGYAAPELAGLRQRLRAKLVEEFEERLVPEDSFLPVLRINGWELQRERLTALEELARDEESLQQVRRRGLVVETAEALLGGRYQRAAEKAAQAAVENRDLPFVSWYQVVALEQARQPQQALDALEDLLREEPFDAEAMRRVNVLRGQILQQLGRTEEATEIYRGVLGTSAN